jgi:hypothetical protein
MQLGAGGTQNIPLLSCLRMQRITRKRQRDPCAAVDERGFTLPH